MCYPSLIPTSPPGYTEWPQLLSDHTDDKNHPVQTRWDFRATPNMASIPRSSVSINLVNTSHIVDMHRSTTKVAVAIAPIGDAHNKILERAMKNYTIKQYELQSFTWLSLSAGRAPESTKELSNA